MGWKLVIAAVGVIGVAVSARGWAQAGETVAQAPASQNASSEDDCGAGGAAGFGAV